MLTSRRYIHTPHMLLNQLFYYKLVNKKSCRLRMATYRDDVKRKGDKIGMGL